MSGLFNAVIGYVCDDIITRAPYLAGEVHALTFVPNPACALPRTDGTSVYWDPGSLRGEFLKDESLPRYRLLHMLAHILLGQIRFARDADSALFLAFDVLAIRFVRSIDPDAVPNETEVCFAALEKYLAPTADPVRMARIIRAELTAQSIGFYVSSLQADDHSLWHKIMPESLPVRHAGVFGDLRGDGYDHEGGGRKQGKRLNITLSQASHTAFARALQGYTEPGELSEPDHDAFDIPLYLYSTETLGAAILEDMEFSEGRKLRSFAIGIDTSGSCARGLTQQFLEVTRDILTKENMFFNRFHLCILQCDDRIRDEAIITGPSEFDRYIEDLRVYGGGNTDFRPVFDRIDALIAEGELPGLRGMLYFSDGKGIFPNSARAYDVTYAFPEGSDLIDVPSWVRRVSFQTYEA